MTNEVESIDYKGYTIHVYRDEVAENPRNSWDHDSLFFNNSRRRTFENGERSITEAVDEELENVSEKFDACYIWVPVYLYEHGGMSVSTTPFGDRWDSGLFGLLAVDKDKVRKQRHWKFLTEKRIDEIKDSLRSEVKEYNQWLTGEVYGYEITIEDDDEVVNSCWGFFGDYTDYDENPLMETAMGEIDYLLRLANEQAERDRIEAERKSCEFWSGENAA